MDLQRTVVIYHANCADGFCAAWIAHRKFGDSADYLPASHGESPPSISDADVYLLDFRYKRDVLLNLVSRNRSVTVLDHHKTAQAELGGLNADNFHAVFDMEKSGGRLAWEHFFGDKPIPPLVEYTEDRDLWRWTLPYSREVNAWLGITERSFDGWDEIGTQLDRPWFRKGYRIGEHIIEDAWVADDGLIGFAVEHGRTILKCQDAQVAAICAMAREEKIAGHRVLAANTPLLISEVAGKLAEGRPFGAAYFRRADGKVQWSLRSRDGGIDVSEIAKHFGGGGHRNAAGFEVDGWGIPQRKS